MINKTITAPKGFLAGGLRCGIKQSGKPDLAMLYCPGGAVSAAVFTTNKLYSAAVKVCRANAGSRRTYAVVVNSGNANACTGAVGLQTAQLTCDKVAQVLALQTNQVLIASTGIIGHIPPRQKILDGVEVLSGKLTDKPAGGLGFAKAIMTTDTRPKQAVRRTTIGGAAVTLAGTAKGAGMIGPNMATTIAVLTTDAAISKPMLQRAFREAIGMSLNRLTVDGHQSTNDTAMILASGQAGNAVINAGGKAYEQFKRALIDLCTDLAKQMALDAEGATRMFTVIVKGARNNQQALAAARAVANYDLVKCAVHGGDPNWGRILCAVGSCGVDINLDKLSCTIGGHAVFKNGQPVPFDPKAVSRVICKKQHTIVVDLGVGKGVDFCYGCDLSREYVTVNADYHT